MRFLLDQDVPDDVVFSLEALQHEVLKLRDLAAASTPDEQVLEHARQHDCVLITCNRDDFLDLAQRSHHPGIIILIRRRTRPSSAPH